MLSLLPWQTPTGFCKQNRDVCVRQQVDQFVIRPIGITLSHSRSRIHTRVSAHVNTYCTMQSSLKGDLASFFSPSKIFLNVRPSLVYVDLNNYASNRVLFDPCQFSLKPYVFSWHLYHIVRLIQTQLSVCVCDFVAGRGGILAWLLVAALPVCLYSSADLVTQRSWCSLKQAVGHRHIWTRDVWHEWWRGCVRGWLNMFVCSRVVQ